jgi:hypothetical protein
MQLLAFFCPKTYTELQINHILKTNVGSRKNIVDMISHTMFTVIYAIIFAIRKFYQAMIFFSSYKHRDVYVIVVH